MASPSPPSDTTDPTRTRLPETGATISSVFDLPYDVADLPGPPPPPPGPLPDRRARRDHPVVPPTFATPGDGHGAGAVESFALPPSPNSSRHAPAPLPAPLAAGTLSGPALPIGGVDEPDDLGDLGGSGVPLPPMVAKGEWSGAEDGAEPVIDVRSAAERASSGSDGVLATSASHDPAPPAGEPAPFPALSFTPDDPTGDATSGGSSVATGPVPAFTRLDPFTAVMPAPGAVDRARPATQTRMFDGLVVAAAAAAVSGAIWWGVVALLERRFDYLALLLGALIGQCALIGGRRGSIALGAFTGVFTLASLAATQYFMSRSLGIATVDADLPLWQGTSFAVELVRDTFRDDPATTLIVAASALIAAVQAGIPGRRAAGQLGLPPAPRRSSIA